MAAKTAYIALGANLPWRNTPPRKTLVRALKALGEAGEKVIARSALWRSPAWPDASKPAYVNAVALLATQRSPDQLLRLLLDVEARFGRLRDPGERNAARTLDLDLIDYEAIVRRPASDEALALPHPRLHTRAFVLLPLAEVAPLWCHPLSGDPINKLLASLPEAEREQVRRMPGEM